MWRRSGGHSVVRLLKSCLEGVPARHVPDLGPGREWEHFGAASAGLRSWTGGCSDDETRESTSAGHGSVNFIPKGSGFAWDDDSRACSGSSLKAGGRLRGSGGWASTVALQGLALGSEYGYGPRNVRFASSGSVGGDGLAFREEESATDVAAISDAVRDLAVNSDVATSSVVGEVAAAAADCSFPTAALQYLIESVHLQSGLPWWASIAAVTVAIRTLVFPIMVYQMKATARLTILRPELERLSNLIKASNYDPQVVAENKVHMNALLKKHKTSPFTPILGALVQAPLFMCFFFAIRNMAEKVESFKEGGALWFTDLSTPDPFYILPILSGVLFLITVEIGAAEGMQGQPIMGKMKMFLRGLAVAMVPLTASFPKALFCYWLTANVFSMAQTTLLKNPFLKKALDIPDTSHLDPSNVAGPVVTFSQPPKQSKVAGPVVTFSQPPKQAKSRKAASRKQ